jgi:hypothetical protein
MAAFNCISKRSKNPQYSKAVPIFISVLGQVHGFDKAHGILRIWAIKVVDFTKLMNCEVLKSMWTNEVAEARKLENYSIEF